MLTDTNIMNSPGKGLRSFDLVDFKVAEADFFLRNLQNAGMNPLTAGFYFSAYSAAARSITFCLQAVLKDLPGFEAWYDRKQAELKQDPLAQFFVASRNMSQKIGVVPIQAGFSSENEKGEIKSAFYFNREHPDFKNLPDCEVGQACAQYLRTLIKIVYECYVEFGPEIDPHQHYTRESFDLLGLTIDDADEELMGVRGWTYVDGWPEAYRWQALRNQLPGCRIDHLFMEYLNLRRPTPPLLPENPDHFDGKEWVPPCLKKVAPQNPSHAFHSK